jgi:riboflavin biosynthesis pyrimidine reductase
MKAGLFDEYRLCIAPIILGEGRQLFEGGLPSKKLSMIESRVVAKDGMLVRYEVK